MAPEKLERLFEPFNRLGAENSKIEGTGIGLVLSRRLVELMRGELRIESALGRGTEASLILACAAEAPAQIGGASPPSQHGTLDESLRVLYAEDNEVNIEIVREVVKLRPSVALDVAESGALAFKKARRDQPAADPGRHEPGRHDRHRAGTGLARGPGDLGTSGWSPCRRTPCPSRSMRRLPWDSRTT